MDKIIVIGCFIPGLAVVRALANKNVHIVAMTYSDNDVAHVSKYVTEVVHIPHPENEPEKFIEFLISNADRWPGALILETADHTAVCLSRHKETLSKYYKIATPDWEILKIFVEKENTYALADKCGIPYPKSQPIFKTSDLNEAAQIQYPCILKPIRSFEFVNKFHTKNFKVNNLSELETKAQLCINANLPIIIQEIIPGPDENLYKLQGYINSQGKMVGKFFHKKIRQSPPMFGVMRVGISTERDEEVEKLTERLLCNIDYRGYFSVEFKKDPRDHQLKLMENNCRMPRSGGLATVCGVNLPWLIYLDLIKNQQLDTTEYTKGLYFIELYADISNSIFNHKMENISFREYIRPYFARNKAFADLDIHDMKPFYKLTTQKIRNVLRNLFKQA